MFTVRIEHDPDVESPAEHDSQWKLYSFSRRHLSFRDPEEFDRGSIKRKLEAGFAFHLWYFEHGQCMWGRVGGHVPAGVEFQWDGVRNAGILVWEHPASDMGPKTYSERAADADAFLEEYTKWVNGETYYYIIEDEDGETIDSCGGFIGTEYMLTQIAEMVSGKECRVMGDFSFLQSELDKLINEHQMP